MREFGVPIKEYFAVDYKKFSHDQMKGLIALFFGLELASVPSPKTQWPAFLTMVNNINNITGIYTYVLNVLNVSTRQVSLIYTTSSPVTIIIRMLSLSRLFSTDTSLYDHSSFPLIHLSINISSAVYCLQHNIPSFPFDVVRLLLLVGPVAWNPITKQNEKWINMDKLIAAYSPDPANDHLGDIPFFLIHTSDFHYIPQPYLKLKSHSYLI